MSRSFQTSAIWGVCRMRLKWPQPDATIGLLKHYGIIDNGHDSIDRKKSASARFSLCLIPSLNVICVSEWIGVHNGDVSMSNSQLAQTISDPADDHNP